MVNKWRSCMCSHVTHAHFWCSERIRTSREGQMMMVFMWKLAHVEYKLYIFLYVWNWSWGSDDFSIAIRASFPNADGEAPRERVRPAQCVLHHGRERPQNTDNLYPSPAEALKSEAWCLLTEIRFIRQWKRATSLQTPSGTSSATWPPLHAYFTLTLRKLNLIYCYLCYINLIYLNLKVCSRSRTEG